MAGFDQTTLDFYQEEAPAYTAKGVSSVCRDLDGFLDRLAPKARILELGCGGGFDSQRMISRGFDVDPTDAVAAIAEAAEARLCQPVRVMQFAELGAAEEYDAVWAQACLLHVPREGLPDILGKVCRALKPGGWHFASFKIGTTPSRDRFGRYFSFFSLHELERIYDTSAGWRIENIHEYEGGGYEGKTWPWAGITVQKYS